MKKMKIKFQTVEIREENYFYDSFVDISNVSDSEINDSENIIEEDPLRSHFVISNVSDSDFNKSENITEEDPLRLDLKTRKVFIKKNVKALKDSESCDLDFLDVDLPHLSSNEIDKKLFICQICKRKIPKMCFLEYIQIDHPYSKLNSFLEKEEVNPSAEKYNCNFCTADFITPKMYLMHLSSKHDRRNYRCSYCSQNSPVKDYLKPHKRFYESYSCEICKKVLSKESYYVTHMSNHYRRQCKICLKIFPKFKSLLSHMQLCGLIQSKESAQELEI